MSFNKLIKAASILFAGILSIFFAGCAGTGETYDRMHNSNGEIRNDIRVLLEEESQNFAFTNDTPLYLMNGDSYLALVNPGNRLNVSSSGENVEVEIDGRKFTGNNLSFVSESDGQPVTYKGISYRGSITLTSDNSGINIINKLSVEEYLRGVIPKEMPTGKGNEYFEALKAFSICARTYTVSKMLESKKNFDVFADTRDQVYGGSGIEKEIVNKVIEETRGLILTYNDKPAETFYHSTCGGYTEEAKNVFPALDLPYLVSVKDGDEPYCSVSPKFMWTEIFPENLFIRRLQESGYIPNTLYSVVGFNINSTFASGRINELEIDLVSKGGDNKSVKLYGNNIRYILKRADSNTILESNNFTIAAKGTNVVINGKGYGHGVGLCQWGALEQSKVGKDFEEILSFYYPGTKIERYND